MKVKELREKLEDQPDEFDVVMSKDAEGNSYSPAADLEACQYIPETTYSGECPHPDDQTGENNAVLLWPVN